MATSPIKRNKKLCNQNHKLLLRMTGWLERNSSDVEREENVNRMLMVLQAERGRKKDDA